MPLQGPIECETAEALLGWLQPCSSGLGRHCRWPNATTLAIHQSVRHFSGSAAQSLISASTCTAARSDTLAAFALCAAQASCASWLSLWWCWPCWPVLRLTVSPHSSTEMNSTTYAAVFCVAWGSHSLFEAPVSARDSWRPTPVTAVATTSSGAASLRHYCLHLLAQSVSSWRE